MPKKTESKSEWKGLVFLWQLPSGSFFMTPRNRESSKQIFRKISPDRPGVQPSSEHFALMASHTSSKIQKAVSEILKAGENKFVLAIDTGGNLVVIHKDTQVKRIKKMLGGFQY